MSSGKPSVFVIESLDYKDECAGRYEGTVLRDILNLSKKDVEYIYIRTRRELKFALEVFRRSDKRYLHLSCHGNDTGLFLTIGAPLTFEKFGALARPYLRDRRLFISACEVTSYALAKQILLGSGCYSVIGPAQDIGFGDAALIWASFYHLAFRMRRDGMNRSTIRSVLGKTCKLFEVPFRYFRAKNGGRGIEEVDL